MLTGLQISRALPVLSSILTGVAVVENEGFGNNRRWWEFGSPEGYPPQSDGDLCRYLAPYQWFIN